MKRPILCRLGMHLYGPWGLTRYDPTRDRFTVHRHCRCGMNQHQLIPGREVPDAADHAELRAIAAARAKKEQP